jgi:chromosome segregation ATPase
MQNEYRPPNGTMNFANLANSPASYRDPDPDLDSSPVTPSEQYPSAEILLGNFKPNANGIKNGGQRQRSNTVLKDPIAAHLLVETALGDSKTYDILPYDELEALKREGQSLQNRINSVRRQLALEAKVRDAAKSLNRLYSRTPPITSSPRLKRASSGLSNKEVLDKAEAQLVTATKKVDELSRELYHLEQRQRQTEMRLLQHTAGILQMTHRGAKNPNDTMYVPGGRPDSPASSDGYRGFGEEPDYDRGFSAGLDNLDGFLDELRSPTKSNGRMSKADMKEVSRQKDAFLSVGKQLEDLNESMRQVLAQVNPEKAQLYTEIPRVGDENIDTTVSQQIEHLSRGLEDIRREQGSKPRAVIDAELADLQERNSELQIELQASLQENLSLEQQKNQVEDDISSQLGNLNNDLYDFLTSINPNNPIPSIPFNDGPVQLVQYTEDRIDSLKTLVQSLSSTSDQSAQYEVVLEGLWQIILAGEEDSRERKRADRERLTAKRKAGEDLNSDDDLSPDEEDGLTEVYSLPAFSTKVQWLVSKSTYLKEKQSSLRQRIQQHRDVAANATARSVDMPAIDELRAQLERTNQLYGTAKDELQESELRFKTLQSSQTEKEARIKSLEEDLKNAAQEAQDEARLNTVEIQAKLDEAAAKAKSLEAQLAEMERERASNAKSHEEQDQVFRKTEGELRRLESEVVRLTTELTVAKTDLEAAYGSRSQRKADWAAAANAEASQRLEDATSKLEKAQLRNIELETLVDQMKQDKSKNETSQKEDELRMELKDTLKEFEDLAKASVDAEKEREDLEGQVDGLREKIEGLEGQLAEEKVKWLGMSGDRSSGAGGAGAAQSTSAMVLKNEFKKMMRDARTEHMKSMRVCAFPSSPFSVEIVS